MDLESFDTAGEVGRLGDEGEEGGCLVRVDDFRGFKEPRRRGFGEEQAADEGVVTQVPSPTEGLALNGPRDDLVEQLERKVREGQHCGEAITNSAFEDHDALRSGRSSLWHHWRGRRVRSRRRGEGTRTTTARRERDPS